MRDYDLSYIRRFRPSKGQMSAAEAREIGWLRKRDAMRREFEVQINGFDPITVTAEDHTQALEQVRRDVEFPITAAVVRPL